MHGELQMATAGPCATRESNDRRRGCASDWPCPNRLFCDSRKCSCCSALYFRLVSARASVRVPESRAITEFLAWRHRAVRRRASVR
jgi:hypothetical protein